MAGASFARPHQDLHTCAGALGLHLGSDERGER